MTQYNKILTTVNSVTSNYNFTPDLSNLIVIDTSNNRIGINKVNPEYSIDVSSGLSDPSGTIRCGTLRVDQIIGRTASMEDLYLGSNTLYIDGIPALSRDQNKNLIIGDVSVRSTLRSIVDIDGSLNIDGDLDICNGSIFLNGFKTISKNAISNKILIENNGGIDIAGTVSFLNVPSFQGGQPAQNDADIAGGFIYNTPIGYTGSQIIPDDGYFLTTQTNDVKVKNRITFSDNLATSFGSPLLSANFDSVDVSNRLTVNNVQYAHVPAGAVMSFAMDAAPDGWLICNGATVSRTTYANLFNAIGVLHGLGDGSNTFQLPDLKDRFVRSSGDNNSVGATNDGSTAKPTTKTFFINATTTTEGSHNHEIRWTQNNSRSGAGTKTGIKHTSVHINNARLFTGEGNVAGMIGNDNGSHNHTVTVTDNLNTNWDDETAPTHIVLLYCIKF